MPYDFSDIWEEDKPKYDFSDIWEEPQVNPFEQEKQPFGAIAPKEELISAGHVPGEGVEMPSKEAGPNPIKDAANYVYEKTGLGDMLQDILGQPYAGERMEWPDPGTMRTELEDVAKEYRLDLTNEEDYKEADKIALKRLGITAKRHKPGSKEQLVENIQRGVENIAKVAPDAVDRILNSENPPEEALKLGFDFAMFGPNSVKNFAESTLPNEYGDRARQKIFDDPVGNLLGALLVAKGIKSGKYSMDRVKAEMEKDIKAETGELPKDVKPMRIPFEEEVKGLEENIAYASKEGKLERPTKAVEPVPEIYQSETQLADLEANLDYYSGKDAMRNPHYAKQKAQFKLDKKFLSDEKWEQKYGDYPRESLAPPDTRWFDAKVMSYEEWKDKYGAEERPIFHPDDVKQYAGEEVKPVLPAEPAKMEQKPAPETRSAEAEGRVSGMPEIEAEKALYTGELDLAFLGLSPQAFKQLYKSIKTGADFVGDHAKELYSKLKKERSQEVLEAEKEYIEILGDRKGNVYEATNKAEGWEKEFSERELNEVGAIIEGINVLEGNYAPKRTARIMSLVNTVKQAFEYERVKLNDYLKDLSETDYIKFLDNYLPHFYTGNFKKFKSRFLRSSPNAKMRKLPTLQDAVDNGLTPLSQNAAYLYKTYAELNWRVAANKKIAKMLQEIQIDGEPAVSYQARDGWYFVQNPVFKTSTMKKFGKPSYAVYSDKGGKARRVFTGEDAKAEASEYARQKGYKIITKRPPGVLKIESNEAWIHPELTRMARKIFENPIANRTVFGRVYDYVNMTAKSLALSVSFFHQIALTESAQAVLANIKNPFRGIFIYGKEAEPFGKKIMLTYKAGKMIEKNAPQIAVDGIKSGLEFESAKTDYHYNLLHRGLMAIEAKTRYMPGINKATKYTRLGYEKYQKHLWNEYHRGLKLYSYYKLTAEAIKNLPESATLEQVKRTKRNIASYVNDAFGGQNWEAQLWVRPKYLHWARRVWLAPDWTLSNFKIGGRLISDLPSKAKRRLAYRYWRNMILTVVGTTEALNYATVGHSTFENERGHELDIDVTPIMRGIKYGLSKAGIIEWDPNEDQQRYYIKLAKQAREAVRWVTNPIENLITKMSPVASELGKQVWGTDPLSQFDAPWKKEKLEWAEEAKERFKSATETFLPFAFRGNNFMFSLPMSKGMTEYKAITQFQNALDAKKWILFGERVTKEDAIKEIHHACEMNGVNGQEMFTIAVTNVRSKYYQRFYDALEKQDWKKVNEIASILKELAATWENVERSMSQRAVDESLFPKARSIFKGGKRPRARDTKEFYEQIIGNNKRQGP